jgi:hypothetical protein
MRGLRLQRPSPAMVVATIALLVALSGTGFAAPLAQLAGLVSGDKVIKKDSLSGNRLRNHTLTGEQIDLAKLGTVPAASFAEGSANATHAESADSATDATNAVNATNATNATTATTATNAVNAGNAANVGGVAPVPPAIPMTLINGWQPYGSEYDQPAYWKDAFGVVHLKGSVAQPTPGSDVLFILPEGFRPARSSNWPATLNDAHFGTIQIESNGEVRSRTFSSEQAKDAQEFTSLEGVSFRPSDP